MTSDELDRHLDQLDRLCELERLLELEQACRALCDDINERYPNKARDEWRCLHMERIAKLIRYRGDTK